MENFTINYFREVEAREGGGGGGGELYDEYDDEESLKWSAIERLPTFDRIRKSVLVEEDDDGVDVDDGRLRRRRRCREIEVKKLGMPEKKAVLDRLVKFAERDNEKFLLKLKNRIARVGIELPKVEVRFENLSVEGEAYIGSRALPTLFNFVANLLEGFLNRLHLFPKRKKPFPILNGLTGIIKPGRVTLLIGPPSSGKTTLLLALAGKLDSNLKVSGKVTYNGHEMNEIVPQRTAAYISQHDIHTGELTVRETLAFSARCQGVGDRYDLLVELSRREKEAKIKPDPDLDIMMKAAALEGQKENLVIEYIMKILGLDICADTQIGNEMLRGISGGQRKRVTTGEMMVGPSKVFLMDEISNGLDSSTTFQIINSIKQCIHILQGTSVISLLQPAPETYDLFDDIILVSEGKIIYQGPRENVLEFFEHMGFKCPARKGVADFLQEITSKKDQEQYWANSSESYEFVSSKKFAEAFQFFHVGQKLSEELAVPFDKSNSHPASLTTKKYGVSKIELFKVCISREFLLMKRNFFLYLFRMTYLIIMAVIIMTLFLRTTIHKDTLVDGHILMGALFAAVLTVMFNGFTELSLTIIKLPVFYKQRDFLFFPAWAYALPTWILNVPITLTESSLWVLITYYVIGFDPNVGRFFKQCLLFMCITQAASGLFRLMGALGRSMIVANTFGSFALLAITVMSGFVLSRDNIKNWLVWGYWLSPMMYAHNAVSVNEFLGDNWKKIPQGMTETVGEFVLKSHGLSTNANFYWIGVGALVGFTFLYNFLYVFALNYLNPFAKSQAILSDKSLVERNSCNNDNELTELSSWGKISSKRINDVHVSVSLGFLLSQEDSIGKEEVKRKGMILPFEPQSLTFENIKYSVDMPQEMKAQGITEGRLELLKGINGSFRPGVLTALMGVSGAGKTTLMDVLAGRKTGGYIEGTITISGFPKKQQTFARIAGYCEQNDIHSPYVTVYESLKYSAWLRLPSETDASTRKMFVKEVMELVELMPLKDALVGLPGVNGLSTEQRKRLTIAVELVANPSIIFMDEPTSGLDARAAAIVMRTVKNTVDTGRTVVCTIHQPSIDIFDSFDELVLLKQGGEEIYAGPIGHHASKLIKYFEGIAGVNRIKDGYNPATWMLEVTTMAQESILGVDFAELYKASELYRRNKALIKELATPAAGSKDLYFPTQYSQPFFAQFIACLWKQNLSYWRNTQYTAVKLLFTLAIAFMIGAMFWNLGSNRIIQQDLLHAMGSMHAAVLFLGLQNSGSVQPVIGTERTVFYRERASGMYSVLPYALAMIVIELPYVLVQTILYGIVVYAMMGFQWTAAKIFWYLLFMFLTLLYFTAYGMMSAAATPNQHIAAIASSGFYGLWNIFSGFIVPKSRIPIWWKWYYYISPMSWSLYGLVASQFGDIKEEMMDTNMKVDEFVNAYFGYRHDFLGYVAVILAGIAAAFTFFFAISIKVLNFQKR